MEETSFSNGGQFNRAKGAPGIRTGDSTAAAVSSPGESAPILTSGQAGCQAVARRGIRADIAAMTTLTALAILFLLHFAVR
jgi:hypothetical protein